MGWRPGWNHRTHKLGLLQRGGGPQDWGKEHTKYGGSQLGSTLRSLMVNEDSMVDGQSLWDAVNKDANGPKPDNQHCGPQDKWR